jgi:hypothetical protein
MTGLLAAAALQIGLVLGPLLSHDAAAQFAPCRSDPVVSLTNGAQIDLSATISDSTSDVKKVVYVVHAPAGTKLLSVVDTSGLLGLTETVQLYADDATNTFDTYTTVYTGRSGVAVTATTTVVSALNLTLGSGSASGQSGQTLHIHFASLL